MSLEPRPTFSIRPAAALLFGCALLELLAAMHHPFVRGHNAGQLVSRMSQFGAVDQAFHALMIAIALATLYAFALYNTRVSHRGGLSQAALILFAADTAGVIGAALIDGFFVPMYAARTGTLAVTPQTALAVIAAGGIAIQILTKFGFILFGTSALLWGIELLQEQRSRIAGAVTLATGCALAIIMMLMGAITPYNLAAVALLQSVWVLSMAASMWTSSGAA